MIRTDELMLGNWVKYTMDFDVISPPVKIETISGRYVDVTNGDEYWDLEDNELVGISITNELLEKCGFERLDKPEESGEWFRLDNIYVLYSKDEFRIADIPVQFLHELQNAYFMLTKNHLTVNL